MPSNASNLADSHEERLQRVEQVVQDASVGVGRHGVMLEHFGSQLEAMGSQVSQEGAKLADKLDIVFAKLDEKLDKKFTEAMSEVAKVSTKVSGITTRLEDVEKVENERKSRAAWIKKIGTAIFTLLAGMAATKGFGFVLGHFGVHW